MSSIKNQIDLPNLNVGRSSHATRYYCAFKMFGPTASIWSFMRFLEWNFRPESRFLKIALPARLSGSFYLEILKTVFFSRKFQSKNLKPAKFRRPTKISERTVQSVFYTMAGVETCFLKLSEELNWQNQVQKM